MCCQARQRITVILFRNCLSDISVQLTQQIPICHSDLRILYYDIVTFSTVKFAVCDIVNEVLALSCSLRISV